MISSEQLKRLTDAIYLALKQNPVGLGEYDLLQIVSSNTILNSLNETGNLGMFQRHFVLKHGLYQLQQDVWQQHKEVIVIEPLKIRLYLSQDADTNKLGEVEYTELSDFYLNWNNFYLEEADVDALLDSFWRDYAKYIQQDEAWDILDLTLGTSLEEVTQRYRELAAIHHPDKGGDQETFVKIRAAYESLKLSLK